MISEEYRKMQSNNPLAANVASQAPQGKSTLDEDDYR